MNQELIYLDANATTPLDPEVLTSMLPFFSENCANAASFSHAGGRRASAAVEQARDSVGELIGAEAKDIIFTSGATESINLALKGYVEFNFKKGDALISSPLEHKAVLDSLDYLSVSWPLIYSAATNDGCIDLQSLEKALSKNCGLVSIQHANNEVGSVNDLKAIGTLCRQYGSTLHVDAAQSAGKIPIDVNEMNIDLLSLSAHKMYGPKGVGALFIRRRNPRIRLTPQQHGGKQERAFRAGTLNVPAIVGFGRAAEFAGQRMKKDQQRLQTLADSFISQLTTKLDGIILNGPAGKGLPGNINFSIPGLDARELLCELPRLAMSTGSACTSELSEPSHVLKAMGVVGDRALGALRVGINRFTTEQEIDTAVELLAAKVIELRQQFKKVEQVS